MKILSRHLQGRRRRALAVVTGVVALGLAVPIALAGTIMRAGAITTADPTQTNRLFRGGTASTCGAPNTASTIAGTYHYDAYGFINPDPSTQCVTATLDTQCANTNFIFAGSYVPSFDPNNITTNNVGDPGVSPDGAPVTWGFNVPGGGTFAIVVAEVTANAGCPAYTLTVSTPGGTPTAVGARDLTARREGGSVLLRWRSGSEVATLGYNLFRGVGSRLVRVNARLIPAAGRLGSHLYAYTDRAAPSGRVRYSLQEVKTDGTRAMRALVVVAG